jgi:hypothetical protein
MWLQIAEWIVNGLHAIGIGHFWVWCSRIFKPATRPLTPTEIRIAQSVYAQSIDYQSVLIDETAVLGPRQFRFAYVSLNLINCYGALSARHFVHEMMHIWQYQHHGIKYIPRALHAQHFGGGYDYGGADALLIARDKGHTILHFNYEQQAEIMADYFCLKEGLKPLYIPFDRRLLPVLGDLVQPVLTRNTRRLV